MSALATDTYSRHYLTADQLRPGDIVLHVESKDRWFAAFDVSAPAGPGDGDVRVWTAVTDQTKGVAEVIDLAPKAAILIARRDTH
jgi:hypothetical protein